MSLYTRIASGVLFPLHERLKGHSSVTLHRHLERSQWRSPEEIRAEQSRRLQGFVEFIAARNPYYRQVMAERGLAPDAIRSVAELPRLPLLTKEIIRRQGDALRSEGADKLIRYNTGGSSGQPLVFYMGLERVSHDVAAKWRATRWWGVDIGDPEIVVWGSPVEVSAQDRVRALRDRALRTLLLPAFEMSEANLDRFVDEIRRRRPAMLFGYPSSIALIARHAESRGTAMDRLGVRVAFVTSEKLLDSQREAIERVFGCPVANGYGGRDAGFIAHACPEGRLHLSAEHIVVETVDPTGTPVPAGTPGEIVVTHLATREFPFVRYRTGDVGTLSDEPCPCGRGLPVLADLQGRTTDFVVAADGTVMHALALIYVIRDLPGIREFKVVQESLEHTRVLLVPDGPLATGTADTVARGLRERLGAQVRVDVEPVESIPREASGKFRYVQSKVAV